MINNQTYTTPCGTTYHVGNYIRPCPKHFEKIPVGTQLEWLGSVPSQGEPLFKISDLPPKPEPEEEWEEATRGYCGTPQFLLKYILTHAIDVKIEWPEWLEGGELPQLYSYFPESQLTSPSKILEDYQQIFFALQIGAKVFIKRKAN